MSRDATSRTRENVSPAASSNADAALAIIHRSDSRVCVTPFAGPVLPEVKKITAGLDTGGAGSPFSGSSPAAKRTQVRFDGVAAGSFLISIGDHLTRTPVDPAAGGQILGPLDVGQQDAAPLTSSA